MATKLPPVPYGSPPGSSFWNDWYEKVRTIINQGTITVTWANIDFSGSSITDIQSRSHNNLQSIQGGSAGERYHLTSAQQTAVNNGITVVINTAKLTGGGANGTMTFTNGILTAQVQAT